MGAKFLADAELGSHDQCLRLCCETDNCDVFVFEEHVSHFTKIIKIGFTLKIGMTFRLMEAVSSLSAGALLTFVVNLSHMSTTHLAF